VLVTACLRVVTISYEYLRVITIFGKSIYKNSANLHHDLTTDIKRDNHDIYERNRLQLYQQFPQLLLQLAQREEEEAQQLPDIVTSHLRILASSLRLVTCCCERFTILTDCYELFTEKINPWTIVRRFLTCQKIGDSFHGSLRVSASCDELFTDTSELFTDACD